MAAKARARRSVLYMPGANLRALEKARSLPADALILDLEDAVAPAVKAEARANVVAALAEGGYGRREVVVRINALDGPWGADDLAALAGAGADAILVPKIESAAMVRAYVDWLATAGAPAELALWAMSETPLGVLNVQEIAAASPRLACLVMGTSDLTKDLQARHTPMRLPMLTSLSLCLLAARARGLAILDGVHLDLQDADGFEAACRQGLELGFDGKTLIHPSQIEPCNRIFAPSADEIANARRTIEAFAAARAEGRGVAVVDGRLVEALHVKNAERVVALAEAVAVLERGDTDAVPT